MLSKLDIKDSDGLKLIQDGLYLITSWEAGEYFRDRRDEWMEFDFEWPEFEGTVDERLTALREMFETNTYVTQYGSCDSPEQFTKTDLYKLICDLPHQFVVTFLYQNKETDGGRRWHKNGPHIGLHEPQCEYFKNEEHIDEIYSFHVYRKK